MSAATLTWSSDAGFQLNLDGTKGSVTVRFMGVTVPADGTDALRSAPVALFDMDMLFNTHIDVGEAPGQLHDAKVQLDGSDPILAGELEDAETGQQEAWSIRLPVTVPDSAPAAGGPVPEEPVEEDLDWDDPGADASVAKPKAGVPSEAGLDSLLRSLMAGGVPSASDDIEEPDDAALAAMEAEDAQEADEEDDDAAEGGIDASLLAALLGGGTAQEDPVGQDMDHARNLLQLLIDREGLALEPGFTVDHLSPGATPILNSNKPPAAMAKALSDFLLDQDAVEELYIDDESLEQLLEQW